MVPLRGGILAALVLHHILTVAVSNGVAVASYTLRSWLGNGYDVRRCIPGQCCATVAGGPDQAPNNQFAVPHGVALETGLDGSTIAHVVADRSDFSVQRCVAGENCTVVAGGNGRGSASNQNHPSDVAIDQAPNGTVLAYVVYDEVRQRVMRCGGTVGNYCVNATPPFNTQSASAAISLSKGPDGRLSHYIVTPRNGGVHSCDVDGSPCVQVVAPENGQRKAVVEYSADGSVVAYVIVHSENHTVVRIGAGGGFSMVVVAGFGGQGGGANQLKAPTDVAIERFADGTPRAYIILDDGNDRVQRCAVGELSCTTTVDGKACGADGFQSAWAFAVEQVKATPTTTSSSSSTTSTTATSTTSSAASTTTTPSSISTTTTTTPAAQCSVGNLLCPIIEGQNYTVLGSENSGPPCTVQPGAASNFLSFATSECNTTTIKEATKETYFATLIPVNNGPIEFVGVGNVVLECRCEVITRSDAVAANVSDVENTLEQRGVNGFSDFVPELSVFVDDEYSIEWPDYVPGENDSALMNFYFQVESGDANDTVGLLNCTTAPSDDENDDLTYTLVDEDCDAGLFEVRRLESPSPHIVRIATRAFLFSNQDRVHFRCAVVRCAAGDATCGSCGAGRRLSDNPTSPAKVVSVVASFPAPSSGSGVLQLGETEEMSATLHCTSALSALIYLVAACATLMVAA